MLRSISRFLFTTSTKIPPVKSALPEKFDPRKSKYSGLVETKNLQTKVERKDAPAYLQDELKIYDELKKSFEVQNIENLKQI